MPDTIVALLAIVGSLAVLIVSTVHVGTRHANPWDAGRPAGAWHPSHGPRDRG